MGDLTNTLDALRSMPVSSAASLLDSIARMQPIMILACNPGCVKNEYEVRKSITLEEMESLQYELQRFLQVSLFAPLALSFCGADDGFAIAPVLVEVGEAYQIIIGIAEPWRVVWENMYNTMMCECLPHPVYGFPVKTDLTDLITPTLVTLEF